MIRDESYGVIPLRMEKGKWNVFLIRHHAGHWGFPKGHAEAKETPLQSALRELKEETHLEADSLLFQEPLEEDYNFKRSGKTIEKKVRYYIIKAKGEVNLQTDEISDGKWLSFEDAHQIITFEEGRKLLSQVENLLGIV